MLVLAQPLVNISGDILTKTFESFQTFSELLKVKPAKTDGTPGSLAHLLNPDVDVTIPKPKSDGRVMRTDICRYPTDPAVVAARQCSSCVCPYCKVNTKVYSFTMNQPHHVYHRLLLHQFAVLYS